MMTPLSWRRHGTAALSPVVLWSLLCCLSLPNLASAVPLSVYGRLPTIEDVSISPDGNRLAFVWTQGDDTRMVSVVSLADSKSMGGLRAGEEKVRALGPG